MLRILMSGSQVLLAGLCLLVYASFLLRFVGGFWVVCVVKSRS